MVPTNGTATIDVATHFNAAARGPQGADSPSNDAILNSTMKGAFYAGLFDSKSRTGVFASCPTGNCTWQSYTSLGICSACEDVASLLTKTEVDGYDQPDLEWKLPGNRGVEASLTTMEVTYANATMKFGHLQDYSIIDLTSVYWPFENYGGLGSPPPKAFECVLYFCVRSYTGKVDGGQFIETMASSFPNASTSSSDARASIHAPPGQSGPALHPNSSVYFEKTQATNSITPPGDSETYRIQNLSFTLIRQWVQSTLHGSIDSNAPQGASVSDVAQVLYDTQVADGGPAPLMARIADSLTSQMRNMTGQSVSGSTQEAKLYVQPRWKWVIFPLVVLALALVFVIATMTMSAVKQIPTWKSSSLPTMVYSLDEATSTAIAVHGPRLERLEEAAKNYTMVMSLDHEMWELEGDRRENTARDRHGRVKPFWLIRRR